MKRFLLLTTQLISTVLIFAVVSVSALQGQKRRQVSTPTVDEAREALSVGDLKRAEVLLETAIASQPSAEVCDLLGIVRDQQNRDKEAEQLYLQALKLNPGLLNARNNLGNHYLKTGRVDDAVKEFQLVLKRDPLHAEANYNLGLVYLQTGAYNQSIAHLEKTIKSTGADLSILLILLEANIKAKRDKGVSQILSQLYSVADNDGKLHFTVGLTLARNGLYEKAAEAFRFTSEKQPQTFEVLYNLGIALYNADKFEEAEKALASAADIKPEIPEVHFRLGLVFSALGDSAGAVEEFKHTIERNPKHTEAHFLMGEEYYKRNAMQAAYDSYEKAVELDPKKPLYHLKLGNACFKLFKYARAEQAYRQLLELTDPKQVEVNYLIGYSLRSQGKLNEAIPFFQKELEYKEKHFESMANLGYLNVELGNFEEAEKYLKATLELKPTHSESYFDLGRMYVKQRKYPEAIELLQKAISFKPDYTQAHYQLFLSYTRTGQKEKADKELEIFKRLEEEDKRERDERERRQRTIDNAASQTEGKQR